MTTPCAAVTLSGIAQSRGVPLSSLIAREIRRSPIPISSVQPDRAHPGQRQSTAAATGNTGATGGVTPAGYKTDRWQPVRSPMASSNAAHPT